MRVIKPSFEIKRNLSGEEILKNIERAGRICYKSEDLITSDSAKKFVKGLLNRGHEAMIEHAFATVIIVCDRGVSHEIVRHRVASYAQESTRYCNYGKEKHDQELKFIDIGPVIDSKIGTTVKDSNGENVLVTGDLAASWIISWLDSIADSEIAYMNMVNSGCPAELARSVLPNSIKTEIVVTMNLREWRHFFKLRAIGTTGKPHPQMVEIAKPLLREMAEYIPVVFDDLIELIS
ncbi:MAG: thymidylate synthase, flavin-dependent [Sedimentibacter sp.]|jgi:thymidylate synthase (FAD)|nr:thymidylate synthase, flavin-dependent [Sedimentibacter sp.]